MSTEPKKLGRDERGELEPWWPATLGLLAVTCIYLALPRPVQLGPAWLPLGIVGAILVPAIILHQHPQHHRTLGFSLSGVVTLFMAVSVVRLVVALPQRTITSRELLVSAALLWLTNVLVFASWYWRLDAGGAHGRAKRSRHAGGAFLFPQMLEEGGQSTRAWSPKFVDYLFLAFNTSTAFSPTDTAVLFRWAKVLMMLQSLISIMVIGILVGRAVNIM